MRTSHFMFACWCGALLMDAHAAYAGDLSANQSKFHAAHRQAGNSLDGRMALLTAELGLDALQQIQVRRILENQREQIIKVWSDTSVPAAQRVNATRVISDGTADQIRALLTEAQKAKYTAARQPRASATDHDKRSVEDWMNAAGSK